MDVISIIMAAGKSSVDVALYTLLPIMVIMLIIMKYLEVRGILDVIVRWVAPLLKPFGGYDNNFCLDGSGLRKVAEAAGDKSGIVMDVETTLEGVQLYTGNFISDRAGKNGARYASYSGFCLETQHYPDAINQPAFPSPVLRQGEPLHETTVYRFCVRK